jgi:hypothetical protein
VRLHPGCGNDLIREQAAEVGLSDLMIFLRAGDPVASVPNAELLLSDAGGTFTECAWRIGEFLRFQPRETMF